MSDSKTVIVNPHSDAGKTGKAWPKIQTQLEAVLGPFQTQFTEAPGHATQLTRAALAKGARQIISVGGDGTLNEIVNGWIENDQAINPEAELSMIMRGTGGDFRKSLGFDNSLEGYFKALDSAPVRSIDLGKVTLTNPKGPPIVRYFINISSFGMGGDVVHLLETNPLYKRLGGTPGFLMATLQSIGRFRPQRVRLRIDDTLDLQQSVRQVAIANGRAHGGGMHMAPKAELDDGWFDLVVLTGVGPLEVAMTLPRVYQGHHLDAPCIRYLRCRQVIAESLDKEPFWIEADGESLGCLPAKFELLPGLLKLKA
jgi:diacylglycerol kinase (ATP)